MPPKKPSLKVEIPNSRSDTLPSQYESIPNPYLHITSSSESHFRAGAAELGERRNRGLVSLGVFEPGHAQNPETAFFSPVSPRKLISHPFPEILVLLHWILSLMTFQLVWVASWSTGSQRPTSAPWMSWRTWARFSELEVLESSRK
jgi:hypothetical protein